MSALSKMLGLHDPINRYLVATGAGIGWVLALGRLFYYNPMTYDKTTWWGMWSYNFIKPWMVKFPSDGPLMKLKELMPEPPLKPGQKRRIARDTDAFHRMWKSCKGSGRFYRKGRCSGAFFWLMLPWWCFSHMLQLPRKFVQFLPPLLVSNLLDFLENPKAPMTIGYKLMLLAALRMICDKYTEALYLFSVSNEGTQPAILGAQSLVLRKLQTISPRARVAISASEIQTLFAKMEGFTAALSMPGQAKVVLEVATLPVGFFFLWRLFGFAAIGASVAVGAGVLGLVAKVGNQKTKSEQKLRALRKKQEAILNELAGNLPIWKLYGWVDYFVKRLDDLTAEMETVGRWNAFWKTLSETLPNAIGPTAVLISVGVNVLLGGKVELVKLLTAGSYITIISSSMKTVTESRQQWRDLCAECANIDEMFELPDAEPLTRSSDGAIRLIDAAFGWPTKPPTSYSVKDNGTVCTPLKSSAETVTLHHGDVVESVDGQKNDDSVRVRTNDGKADGWIKTSALKQLPDMEIADWQKPAPGIADINLHITQGELVLVSGPVASGKSTLLQSLVGNTEMLEGSLEIPHSVAFQPQSPILFDQTIRANILFGIADDDANEEYMQQALQCSTLTLDIDDPESTLHAKRELTSAGQNGSELSGGQQARVALARCIYAALAGSECVILDDPIKALDPHTASKCWDNMKDVMVGKTRVMVVNSQMLQRFASDKAVDRLIIIENAGDGTPGRITYNGKPSEMPLSLQQSLGDGYGMLDEAAQLEADSNTAVDKTESQRDATAEKASSKGEAKVAPESPGAKHDRAMQEKKRDKKAKSKKVDSKKKDDKKKGSIPAAVAAYCRRMGPWILVSAFGNVLSQTAGMGLFWWNEKWAHDSWGLGFKSNYVIAVGFMVGAQVTKFFQGVTDGAGREVASKSIRLDTNKKLSVLAMPYLWHPDHSTAQLVDLVTKDPQEYGFFALMPLILAASSVSLGMVLYSRPLITPVAVVALYLYKHVKKPFGWGIRQVYGGLIIEAWVGMRKFSGELFDASTTIRAMGREEEFNAISNKKFYQNFQLSPLFFGSLGRSNFYGMVVDTAWATISMAALVSMRGQLAPAVAIAVYNQLEELNNSIGLFFTVNDAAAQTLPNWMKVMDFLAVKESVGKPCIEDDNRPAPPGWPADGGVQMKDVVFDYRTGAPSALNGISIDIQPGEKIGVCGRTGAGKSTLLSVLFSLGPLSGGSVSVAGHNLVDISCHEVRRNIAIVPQFPTLFDGTVRENLIGGNEVGDSSDASLLDVLRSCRLQSLGERGLDGLMGKLSDGQRQLFCVARALVRKPKILVLDESTADLDQESANELLRVIDENFAETTVISIAHRLNFIRNSDRILVLNTGGTINAFDTPDNLLKDQEGYFYRQLTEENSGIDS